MWFRFRQQKPFHSHVQIWSLLAPKTNNGNRCNRNPKASKSISMDDCGLSTEVLTNWNMNVMISKREEMSSCQKNERQPIHPNVVQTFHSKQEMSVSWWHMNSSLWSYPLVTMTIKTKCQGNPSGSLRKQSDWQTHTVGPSQEARWVSQHS